jgi:hypothetical protein
MMKNKTLAAWLAFVGGPFGLHRFYLFGASDRLAWLLPAPTLAGLYGVLRARSLGLDDPWSWVLIPMLGFTIAGCAVNALVYGLMAADRWNQRFNPEASPEAYCGQSNWLPAGWINRLAGKHCLQLSALFRIPGRGSAPDLSAHRCQKIWRLIQ